MNFFERMLLPGDVEVTASNLKVSGTEAEIATALTLGNTRRRLLLQNNSNGSSGEIYIGPTGITSGNGFTIPKALAPIEIPLAASVSLYAIADSGELGDLRILEIS